MKARHKLVLWIAVLYVAVLAVAAALGIVLGAGLPAADHDTLMRILAERAPALLFVATTGGLAPFKGGLLVAVPVLFALPGVTDAAGTLELGWIDWPAAASGQQLVLQFAVADAAASAGVALSNALVASPP